MECEKEDRGTAKERLKGEGRKRENSTRTFPSVVWCLSVKGHQIDEITERAVYRHARTFRIVLNARVYICHETSVPIDIMHIHSKRAFVV